jgi:hypothetical protein
LIEGGYGYCVGRHADARPSSMNTDYSIQPEKLARAVETLLGIEQAPRSGPISVSPAPVLDVSFDNEGGGKGYLIAGWAEPDTRGTWTVAPTSLMQFPNPVSAAGLRCSIRMLPFTRPPYVTEQKVVLSIAGTVVCDETISKETEVHFDIPPLLKGNGETISILFQCPNSIPPIMVGERPDARFFGVACLRLTLTLLPQGPAAAPG